MAQGAATPPPGRPAVPEKRGPAWESRQKIARLINGPRRSSWNAISDDELLRLKFCDLDLRIRDSLIATCIRKLFAELEARSLKFRPFFWISSEFFSPDGVPGIAVPFYLVHPRLKQLERAQMVDVEGGTQAWCMRILRHETGHALDTAYRLRRRKRWRELFGKASIDYPTHYAPVTNSKDFVLHLDWWYGQSHPVEDFAETFAVWLAGPKKWRRKYGKWPAIRKLEYVDELMGEISGVTPPVRYRKPVDPLWKIKKTLRRHYNERREHYRQDLPDAYDEQLKKIFAKPDSASEAMQAHKFLASLRPEIRKLVAGWTGQHPYAVSLILKGMIGRARTLGLVVDGPPAEASRDVLFLATSEMMTFLRLGRHSIAL
jgi:hypothetical protein